MLQDAALVAAGTQERNSGTGSYHEKVAVMLLMTNNPCNALAA